MPELPEVETVRRGLEQLVVGKNIKNIDVYWNKIIESPSVTEFKELLQGETIEKIARRGKYLIFVCTHWELISHLRMEGKYEFTEQAFNPKKHLHVAFHFTDGSTLEYHDVRKFGRMALVPKGTAEMYKGIEKLGPEPIPTEFSLTAFTEQLKKARKAVKPLLLEQKIVTGLGNIYVDEALFSAKIHPEQPAASLTTLEMKKLHAAIIEVLANAVEAGGTTIRTYQNALGEAGKFQVELKVYGQTDKPCERCGTPIVKTKVAQRGTHYCPHCQKLHG